MTQEIKPDCHSTGQKEGLEECDDCNWRDSCDAEEVEFCGQCNGTGEGMYDGERCSRCKGSGVVQDTFREDPPDWWLDEQRERSRERSW